MLPRGALPQAWATAAPVATASTTQTTRHRPCYSRKWPRTALARGSAMTAACCTKALRTATVALSAGTSCILVATRSKVARPCSCYVCVCVCVCVRDRATRGTESECPPTFECTHPQHNHFSKPRTRARARARTYTNALCTGCYTLLPSFPVWTRTATSVSGTMPRST